MGLWDAWVDLVTGWQTKDESVSYQSSTAAQYCFTDAEAGKSVCMNGSGESVRTEDASLVYQPTQQSIPGVTQYSDDVAQAQRALVAKGYDVGKAGVDGLFGPDTGRAVLAFQKDRGLTQTGKLDTSTMAALFDVPKSQATAIEVAKPTATKNAPQDQALKIALVVGGLGVIAVGAYLVMKNKPQY